MTRMQPLWPKPSGAQRAGSGMFSTPQSGPGSEPELCLMVPSIMGRRAQRARAVTSASTTVVRFAPVTSETVGQAYANQDPLAGEILLETVDVLTPWLGNIVDLFDPDVIVIGGG